MLHLLAAYGIEYTSYWFAFPSRDLPIFNLVGPFGETCWLLWGGLRRSGEVADRPQPTGRSCCENRLEADIAMDGNTEPSISNGTHANPTPNGDLRHP